MTSVTAEIPETSREFIDELDESAAAIATIHELSLTRSKLGDLLDELPAGVLVHQEQGIVYANREAQRLLGTGHEPLIGRHLLDFADPSSEATLRDAFFHCIHHGKPVRAVDARINGAGGQHLQTQVSMAPLPWEGLPVLYVVVADITTLKESEERLRLLAITDPLTGLFNRRYFMELANREIGRSRRYGGTVSLMSIDIDHFKHINDGFGHAIGDLALKTFADACRDTMRSIDVLARMGGEEFAILLPETGLEAAQSVAERIRQRIEELSIPAGNRTVHFTVSIGISSCLGGGRTLDSLLSSADEALYRAKKAGRNRVVATVDTPFI